MIPRHQQNITGLKLLLSGRLETELVSPYVVLTASDGFDRRSIPRRQAIFGKLGARYEGLSSWIEFGGQWGFYRQVTQLALGPNNTCTPGSLSNCMKGTTSALLDYETSRSLGFRADSATRQQSGMVLNARVAIALPIPKLQYIVENRGNFYFGYHNDLRTDPSYLEVMTHSLVVPVIGNLSVVPKVDLFLFKNKVAGSHIHGYQTSVTAQYDFDWHRGVGFWNAARYRTR